ncbi:M56 family metallopeptidase [Demequina sp. SO4-18]|uniref:M56 family metallopeptidase n=1 Tax=Demequina sp. SO4-18 TaxID=3401026 RepID=UPI003B59FE0B
MSALVASVALATGVMSFAVLGPLLLRRSAPALMRVPRIAVAIVSGGMVAWALALVSLGPVVAWSAAGPALLSGSAGEVCQRCLASANPFGPTATAFSLPAAVPVALAAATAVWIGAGLAVEVRDRRRNGRATAAWLRAATTPATVRGQRVLVVTDDVAYAWTMPSRHGGIVVSSGALSALTDGELDAVLAHERAHLRQRHHALAALAAGLRRSLGWVPYMRSATEALPHYLEIAADAHAQRAAGTPALASALLVLGAPATIAGEPADRAHAPVLHVAGPHRIGRLVGASSRGGEVSASTVAGVSLAYATLGIATLVPYAFALATGCV